MTELRKEFAAPIKFRRVGAGWYETTAGEPVEGTYAISRQVESEFGPYWNIARYNICPWDGGLNLDSTGETGTTLAEAKELVLWLIENQEPI